MNTSSIGPKLFRYTPRALLAAVVVIGLAGPESAVAQEAQQLFATRCAACHGADATGGFGPDLTQRSVTQRDAEELFRIIRGGVPGTAMPPSTAPEGEIRALVSYLHSFGPTPPPPAADWSTLTGDADRGEALFLASCARCHTAEGDGGTTGPELTNITDLRSRQDLVLAIRDPGETILNTYESATVVTREGQQRGVIVMEDDANIRLRMMDGRERNFPKAELLDLVHDQSSMMPAFSSNRLREGELNDVLVYLRTVAARN